MSQQPSAGRIVHLRLSKEQAEQINRRRTTSTAIYERLQSGAWPAGAQAHIGNIAAEGDIVPLLVVRVWPDEYGPGIPGVNGQAFLDGNDTLWVTSAREGTEPGTWFWPPRT